MLHKKLLWITVIWLVILQTMSPLIHAHIEADVPEKGVGIHMHMDEIVPVYDKTPTLKSFASSLHVVSVDKALVKDVQAIPVPLLAVLFSIFILSLVVKEFNLSFTYLFPSPAHLRPRSKPRAPPLF